MSYLTPIDYVMSPSYVCYDNVCVVLLQPSVRDGEGRY